MYHPGEQLASHRNFGKRRKTREDSIHVEETWDDFSERNFWSVDGSGL
jgi:hypothetical protein